MATKQKGTTERDDNPQVTETLDQAPQEHEERPEAELEETLQGISRQQHDPYADEAKKKNNNAIWYGIAIALAVAAGWGIYESNRSAEEMEVIQSKPAQVAPDSDDASSAQTNSSATDTAPQDNSSNAVDVVAEQPGQVDDVSQVDEPTETAAAASNSAVDEATASAEAATIADEYANTAVEDDDAPADEVSVAVDESITAVDEARLTDEETLTSADEASTVTEEATAAIDESNAAVEEGRTSADAASAATEEQRATASAAAEVMQQRAAYRQELAQTNEQVEAANQTIRLYRDQLSQLEQQFEQLNARQQAEIERLQQALVTVQQEVAEASVESADQLLLNDINRLLQSAENELRLTGNAPNAVAILSVAQRIAGQSRNPMFEGLIGAIGADIVKLKSIETATVEDMFIKVQRIADLIQAAPLLTPDYASHSALMTTSSSADEVQAPSETSPTSGAEPSAEYELALSATGEQAPWYQRAWNSTKVASKQALQAVADDLGNLVRIEELSAPDSGLLTAEQGGVLRGNLKLQLSFAQQALLAKQQAIWQRSLLTVQQGLAQYFREDSSEYAQAQHLLEELLKASVTPALPEIDLSRRALVETYEQLRLQQGY